MPGDTPPLCERCLKPARDEIHGPVETCRENGRGGCNEPKAHHAFRPARTAPAPLAFDAALAALDVEPTHHTDRMVTTYDILGLDAVRAAHRAEVERAVAERDEAEGANILNRNAVRALSARVAKLEALARAVDAYRSARLLLSKETEDDLVRTWAAEAATTYRFMLDALAAVEAKP